MWWWAPLLIGHLYHSYPKAQGPVRKEEEYKESKNQKVGRNGQKRSLLDMTVFINLYILNSSCSCLQKLKTISMQGEGVHEPHPQLRNYGQQTVMSSEEGKEYFL